MELVPIKKEWSLMDLQTKLPNKKKGLNFTGGAILLLVLFDAGVKECLIKYPCIELARSHLNIG